MTTTTVYECPECNDRKMLIHRESAIHPRLWCNCDGFTTMDVHYTSQNDD